MRRDSDVTLYVELNNVTNSRITLHHYLIYTLYYVHTYIYVITSLDK